MSPVSYSRLSAMFNIRRHLTFPRASAVYTRHLSVIFTPFYRQLSIYHSSSFCYVHVTLSSVECIFISLLRFQSFRDSCRSIVFCHSSIVSWIQSRYESAVFFIFCLQLNYWIFVTSYIFVIVLSIENLWVFSLSYSYDSSIS